MDRFADLHLHTLFSDGTYSPEELVSRAIKSGISVISVVDHDTVEGVAPVCQAAKECSLEALPGIELTAEYEGAEIHILGYFIDYLNKPFLEKLDSLKDIRVQRVNKIAGKLHNLGFKFNVDAVFGLSGCGTVGRLHIARAMVKEGVVKSIPEAFQKYIGDQGPAYVGGFKFSPQQAIELIKSVGGVSVLAHPYSIRRDELIPYFVDCGLAGLEVYYPEHTQAMINFYLGVAKQYGLVVTGGSDCHGQAKPEVKIGQIKLPYELVEKLKQARKND